MMRTVAFDLFGYSIHWYGILYVVAFWIGYALLPHLAKYRRLTVSRDCWTWIIVYAALGVMLGGRLGYIVFYEPVYFLDHPLELFQIWNGGMSSHGGFVGVGIALSYAAKKCKVSLLSILDVITVPVAIGLALGRVGNFINQELGGLHYPVQLIDAACMLVIAMICYAVLRLTPSRSPSYEGEKSGRIISFFLILYSITRFLLEYIRIQEWSYIAGLTRGQFLTIPLFITGVLLFLYARNSRIRSKIRPT